MLETNTHLARPLSCLMSEYAKEGGTLHADGKGALTSSDEPCNVAVTCHFSVRNLLDRAVDGVEERFCFICSRHGFSCWLHASVL
jgi:hypothetical protein